MANMVEMKSQVFVAVDLADNAASVSYGFIIHDNYNEAIVTSFDILKNLQSAVKPEMVLHTLKENIEFAKYCYFVEMIKKHNELILDKKAISYEQLNEGK